MKRLAETCNVSEAARVAGIGRQSVYEWRDDDPVFAQEWKEAEEQAADKLELEAWTRATEDKSDRMLEILLKAHRPEKFVDRYRAEHVGRDGGPIEYRNLSEDEINARLAKLVGIHGPKPLAD